MEKKYNFNTNEEKAGVALLTSDKEKQLSMCINKIYYHSPFECLKIKLDCWNWNNTVWYSSKCSSYEN